MATMAKVTRRRAIQIRVHAPTARRAVVVGTFNGWDASAHPMRRDPSGTWQALVVLEPGHHEYEVVVDGVSRERCVLEVVT